MGLIEEARLLAAEGRATQCGLGRWLQTLTAKERAEWAEVLADPGIGHNVIGKMLRARDVPVQEHTIGTHRRGRCKCGVAGGTG